MSYWSGEKLLEKIKSQNLIFPYDPLSIDCAAYTLEVGDEAFVSQDLINTEPHSIKQNLSDAASADIVRINPGQFAFLLTHETVSVPKDAIAFISIKSKYKFKGLINVSGFHVDPGFSGKLIFGVYNAGPTPIMLQRREPVFLIFYADLDRETEIKYAGKSQARTGIGSDLIQNMTGQVFSPLFLQRKMERLEEAQAKLDKAQTTLVAKANLVSYIAWAALGGALSITIFFFSSTTAQVMLGGWINHAIDANAKYKDDLSQIELPMNAGLPKTKK